MKKVFSIGAMCLMALTLHAQNEGPKPEFVDLGVSVKWATCNLGASKPEDFGDYYAWGETEPYYDALGDPIIWKEGKDDGYKWSSYSWCKDGEYTSLTKYNTVEKFGVVDNMAVLEEADDAARAKLGGNCRIPTDAEWTVISTGPIPTTFSNRAASELIFSSDLIASAHKVSIFSIWRSSASTSLATEAFVSLSRMLSS